MIKVPYYEWIEEITPESNYAALKVLNSHKAEFELESQTFH